MFRDRNCRSDGRMWAMGCRRWYFRLLKFAPIAHSLLPKAKSLDFSSQKGQDATYLQMKQYMVDMTNHVTNMFDSLRSGAIDTTTTGRSLGVRLVRRNRTKANIDLDRCPIRLQTKNFKAWTIFEVLKNLQFPSFLTRLVDQSLLYDSRFGEGNPKKSIAQ